MSQDSIYYAAGRLSVLQKNILDQSKLERVLQADTPENAANVLGELGWNCDGDWERFAFDHFNEAARLVRRLIPEPRLADACLIRYDINNLKILYKARCLNVPYGELSSCGVTDRAKLIRAVYEKKYTDLPETLVKAMERIEKRLMLRDDPLYIDCELDKAMYQRIFEILEKKDTAARKYFTAKADIVNYIMVLRGLHMNISLSMIRDMLIPCGKVTADTWIRTAEKPEKLCLLLHDYGTELYRAAVQAGTDHHLLAGLEKKADDYLLSVYHPYKNSMESPERIIAYLLMRERESSAVKLIMAGKKNGFSNEVIRERLRELYA